MFSSAGSVLLRLGAWSYAPDFATQKLLSFYHQFLSSRGGVPPQRGSPRWQAHYRTAYAIVVLAYLSYNLVEAARSTPPNFYQILGVTPDVDDVTLRGSYRVFAKRYHPDRAGPASEPLFMTLQNAYEALKNPMKRFAYERFGPDALRWQNCSAPMDYLKQGIMQSSGFYIVSGTVLIVISLVGRPSPVAFWRYILLLSLFACELCLTAGPRSFGLLGLVFPDRVAFQHVLFLHQLFVFLSVALSRVVPVLFPEDSQILPEDPRTYAPWLLRLEAIEKLADAEVLRLLHLELHAMSNTTSPSPVQATSNQRMQNKTGTEVTFDSVPPCNPRPEILEKLTKEMEDILVEQFVRAEPPLRALWDEAVLRLRREREREGALGDRDGECDASGVEKFDVRRERGRERYSSLLSPSPSLSPEVPIRVLPRLSRADSRIDQSERDPSQDGSLTPTGSISSRAPSPSPSRPSPSSLSSPSSRPSPPSVSPRSSPPRQLIVDDSGIVDMDNRLVLDANASDARLASTTAFIRVVEKRSGLLESE